jgi:hypothetical protein
MVGQLTANIKIAFPSFLGLLSKQLETWGILHPYTCHSLPGTCVCHDTSSSHYSSLQNLPHQKRDFSVYFFKVLKSQTTRTYRCPRNIFESFWPNSSELNM